MTSLGRAGAGTLYFLSSALVLVGPAVLASSFRAGLAALITGIVTAVVLIPVGLALLFDTVEGRALNRRLDAVGVPAVAEILDMTEIAWSGEEDGVRLRLRVSGPGFPPFEADWTRDAHPLFRVGLRWPATVDPSDLLFRVLT